jgi:hypothetical protein
MHVEPSKQRRRRYACEFHDRYGLLALALYAAASIFFFGRGVLSQLSTAQIGKSSDPPLVMWFLAWWPHAIANHLNPFFSQAVFAPAGVNIGWTMGIPILSLMAAPITVWVGPIVSYNVPCMLCPALAAWATFILCRAVTGAWWPSLMGGYLFGSLHIWLAKLPPISLSCRCSHTRDEFEAAARELYRKLETKRCED